MTRSEWIRRARAALRKLQAPRPLAQPQYLRRDLALLGEELARRLAEVQRAPVAAAAAGSGLADPAHARLLIRAEAAADGWTIRS